MFGKLAFRNVRRQISNYLIYFFTVALSVALMFAVNNLSYSEQVRSLSEVSSDMNAMFAMVTILACLVTALVLSYAAAFMLKLRKREFGMYLTLGMSRRDIRMLYVCETGLLSLVAIGIGLGAGLILFQFLAALFAAVMEFPFTVSAYSVPAILLTLAVSIGMFLLSTLASLKYLNKVTISELLKEEAVHRSEQHTVRWCIVSGVTVTGLLACMAKTVFSLWDVFHTQDSVGILLWLVMDLVMVFAAHFSLARAIAGMLLKNRHLKNRGTNTVVFRSLSGKMTMNAMLIGALATFLVFATGMLNVAFGEKIYSDFSLKKDCPYDAMALYDLSETQGISMEEGRAVIEKYSTITAQIDYQLYSMGSTDLCSSIIGFDVMGWTDKFMPLSQFNALLTGCGCESIALEQSYLVVTSTRGICDVDFSDKVLTFGGKRYTWAGSSSQYPDFFRGEWFYIVIPDEALVGMRISDAGAAYTLKDKRPDVKALLMELTYYRNTEYGPEEECDYHFQEDWRLYSSATAGTLIVGTLYVSTVFVCMTLAILALKTLSTMEDERRRFQILYCLGADVRIQRKTLLKQTAAFFLMPYVFPVLLTVPFGVIFGKVYEIWGLEGLSGHRAMETAVVIAAVISGIYALYFFITYRIACRNVLCFTGKK